MDAKLRKSLIDTIRDHVGCGMDEAMRMLDSPPSYVRELRDRAAVGFAREYLRHRLAQNPADAKFGQYDPLDVGVKKANALVRALGYEPPEEG